jgi:hypothetical protein
MAVHTAVMFAILVSSLEELPDNENYRRKTDDETDEGDNGLVGEWHADWQVLTGGLCRTRSKLRGTVSRWMCR